MIIISLFHNFGSPSFSTPTNNQLMNELTNKLCRAICQCLLGQLRTKQPILMQKNSQPSLHPRTSSKACFLMNKCNTWEKKRTSCLHEEEDALSWSMITISPFTSSMWAPNRNLRIISWIESLMMISVLIILYSYVSKPLTVTCFACGFCFW